jgi:hypothetical protein
MRHEFHLSDEAMVSFQAGEIHGIGSYRIRRHLKGCALCRSRAEALDGAMQDFSEQYGIQERNAGLSGQGAGARALLRARMEAERRTAEDRPALQNRGFLQGHGFRMSLLYGLAMVAFVAVSAWLLHPHPGDADHGAVVAVQDMQEPNVALTPGATRDVALSDICPRADDDDQDPAVPASLQETVYKEYGVNGTPRHRYQVDYLISPQLGGTNDLHNLWPQPYDATEWNAQAKDALEARLHDMVCGHQIDLTWAQHEIASDWIGTYRRVFHTDSPLKAVSSTTVDERLPFSQFNQ